MPLLKFAVPTYEALPRFAADLHRLSPEQRRRFRQAVAAFVDDLRTGRGRFRAGLRVKGGRSAPGPAIHPGEQHVIWRRIGTRRVRVASAEARRQDRAEVAEDGRAGEGGPARTVGAGTGDAPAGGPPGRGRRRERGRLLRSAHRSRGPGEQRVALDGNVTGYSVAMPGDRDGGQRAVWFPGARLAFDLSLPRVRERWTTPVSVPTIAPAEMWQEAEQRVRAAADQLGAGGLHQGAGDVVALGDLIVIAAVISPRMVRDRLRDAAFEFERASHVPGDRALEGQARTLYRESTQLLSQSVAAAGCSDTVAALGFLLALVTAIEASRRWHEAQEYRAQAQASARAGRLLREAVEVTAGASAAREFRLLARPRTADPTADSGMKQREKTTS
ncbi:hypothetical protein [Streptomyces rochei]|uniref:hypothetical protein n=1 Tax=Streptomyces rochei TaxID=1928 RepID=UPI0036C4F7FC